MDIEDTIKCNNCESLLSEDDLVSVEDNDGFLLGCPTCLTDSFLTDIIQENLK